MTNQGEGALPPPPLAPPPDSAPATRTIKPPPDRLYGRIKSHTLRPRQRLLLDETLPRIRFDIAEATHPRAGFPAELDELWLEVGFGGGEHALAQIEANPRIGLIACEVFELGLCSLLSRLVADDEEAVGALPGNLRLFDDDARMLIRALPDGCLHRIFLMFPDPWPKSRHAKRRFVHPALLADLARVLVPGGIWRIASDDPTYQAWVSDVMGAQTLFDVPAPATSRPDGWPPTRYEAKALRAGRQPLYWQATRKPPI
jgi:tRNA (guanine-N7-)-methyltransferase